MSNAVEAVIEVCLLKKTQDQMQNFTRTSEILHQKYSN